MIKEERLAQLIAETALDEKAADVVILDVGPITVIADYFVIAGGRSAIQVRSIAERIEEKLADEGIFPARGEGRQEGKWVVLDYNSVIVHVFRQEERDYYELERLWADARRMEL